MREQFLHDSRVVVALGGGALATAAGLAGRRRLAVTLLLVTGAAAFLVQDRPVPFATTEGVRDDDAQPDVAVAHDPATDLDPGQE